jgi:hypothetical protein
MYSNTLNAAWLLPLVHGAIQKLNRFNALSKQICDNRQEKVSTRSRAESFLALVCLLCFLVVKEAHKTVPLREKLMRHEKTFGAY